MILTDNEKQFLKDQYRIKQINDEIKQKQDIMWSKVETLKDQKEWDKIQDEKQAYRDDIADIKNELEELTGINNG
jgi:hypothetical protein